MQSPRTSYFGEEEDKEICAVKAVVQTDTNLIFQEVYEHE